MEIRNNTPSFGMTFRKPENMEKFSKYVVGSSCESLKKRGLAKIVKRQANNEHFDLEYRPGEGVAVIPKSEAARRYHFFEEIYGKGSVCPDVRGRYLENYTGEAYDKAYEAASGSKRFLMTTKRFFAGMRLLGNVFIHPEEMLPSPIRLASKRATAGELLVKGLIAKDAQALASKQKLESEIEAIFSPKPKTIKF